MAATSKLSPRRSLGNILAYISAREEYIDRTQPRVDAMTTQVSQTKALYFAASQILRVITQRETHLQDIIEERSWVLRKRANILTSESYVRQLKKYESLRPEQTIDQLMRELSEHEMLEQRVLQLTKEIQDSKWTKNSAGSMVLTNPMGDPALVASLKEAKIELSRSNVGGHAQKIEELRRILPEYMRYHVEIEELNRKEHLLNQQLSHAEDVFGMSVDEINKSKETALMTKYAQKLAAEEEELKHITNLLNKTRVELDEARQSFKMEIRNYNDPQDIMEAIEVVMEAFGDIVDDTEEMYLSP